MEYRDYFIEYYSDAKDRHPKLHRCMDAKEAIIFIADRKPEYYVVYEAECIVDNSPTI